jgi:hypothetical protein
MNLLNLESSKPMLGVSTIALLIPQIVEVKKLIEKYVIRYEIYKYSQSK